MDKPFPAYDGNDAFVFVCYAHHNEIAVYADLQMLHDKGVNVWYDEGISGGKIWRAEIAGAIQGAAKLLFFISAESLQSTHCAREIEYALDHGLEMLLTDISANDGKTWGWHISLRRRSHFRARLAEVRQRMGLQWRDALK